jgi:hypothetical protein
LLLEGRSWIRIRKAKKDPDLEHSSSTLAPISYLWSQDGTLLIELNLFLEMRLPRKPRKRRRWRMTSRRRWRMTSKRSTRKTCKSLNGEGDKPLNGEGDKPLNGEGEGEGVLHRPL